MTVTTTALSKMREHCLSLPDTTEGDHFGESCFRVRKRIFATCGEKDGVCRLVFQLEPDHARRLAASDCRFQPYPRQADCVFMNAADVDDWDEVRALVFESDRLNAPEDREPKRRSARRVGAHGKPAKRAHARKRAR